MPTKLDFTSRALLGLAENKDANRDVQRAAKHFKPGDLIPETIRFTANSILADKTRAMSFSTGRGYLECLAEVLHHEPWLRLGVCGYLPDKHFTGVNITEEASPDDET